MKRLALYLLAALLLATFAIPQDGVGAPSPFAPFRAFWPGMPIRSAIDVGQVNEWYIQGAGYLAITIRPAVGAFERITVYGDFTTISSVSFLIKKEGGVTVYDAVVLLGRPTRVTQYAKVRAYAWRGGYGSASAGPAALPLHERSLFTPLRFMAFTSRAAGVWGTGETA